jgi:hypothetical protein
MIKDNLNSATKWEGIVDGSSRVMNSGILPKQSCNNIKGKALSPSSRNINFHKKLFHQPGKLVPLTVYHQNIRGLRGKELEILGQLYPISPHSLCLSEHHMNNLELQQTFLECYNLGDSHCRSLYEKGGVCILVHEKLKFSRIDLTEFCKDKDLEVCAVKVYLNSRRICIIAIYRAPSGNFDFFITKLDTILKKII